MSGEKRIGWLQEISYKDFKGEMRAITETSYMKSYQLVSYRMVTYLSLFLHYD